MRGIDWDTAIAAREHWAGRPVAGARLCPLLADLDRLLAWLDEIGLTPGDAVACCPECGEEHRWALIKELMIHAYDVRGDRPSRLMQMVDGSLEPVREAYGGREKHKEVRQGAEAFFSNLPTDKPDRAR